MINCIECGKSFVPLNHRHKFCSLQCRERFKARKKRLKRQEQGLCPQCGKPMDYPIRIGKGKSTQKQKISYCSECRKKWQEIYLSKRG